MLTSISLQNFKCYKDKTTFPLSKINLLTGINGKGKSTFLQSMLLFKQTVEHDVNATALLLNGDYVKLGTFQDVKNSDTSINKPILIEFGFETPVYDDTTEGEELEMGQFVFSYELISEENTNFELIANSIEVACLNFDISPKKPRFENKGNGTFFRNDALQNGMNLFLWDFVPSDIFYFKDNSPDGFLEVYDFFNFSAIHFVSADRLGPQEYYPKFSLKDFLEVGKRGEKTLDVLDKVKNKVLESDVRVLGEDNSILALSGEWLSYILDTKVSVIINSESSYISTLKFRFNDKVYTPSNIGFGYSYILPIIVAGLVAKEGEILIIENPEAHLHPGAQSRLAEFLARVASMGVQVFIESHSEHILNGIRIAAIEREGKPKILENTDISILYFQGSDKETFVSIPVEPDGKIRKWPEGFFDQLEKDTEILYNL
jgi:predicted ATPase